MANHAFDSQVQARGDNGQGSMPEDLQHLKVALRVLGAITEFREPEETDIQALRSFAPLLKSGAADELAREVIQKVLKARGRSSSGMAEKAEAALRNV